MPRPNLTIDIAEPIELSTPRDIRIAISEALEEERAIILQDPQNRVWSKVLEILHGVAKQRFFTRVIAKLPSTLQQKAYWAAGLKTNVREYHIKFENLERFLIALNFFFGSQANSQRHKCTGSYSYNLLHNVTVPRRSTFFNFLTDLGES
jgi:poly(A) polymerase Pap1